MEQVILVDEHDNAIGMMEKMEAHRKGLLHRAFSVVVFNSAGEMLLQKRALSKYHSGGLWTNACCSHPQPDESVEASASRRVKYEMGIDVTPVFAFKFTYLAALDHGLIEHELDHVFTATYDQEPRINAAEVDDWKYISLSELKDDMVRSPERYTVWFRDIVEKLGVRN